jgi:type I restriction enzyme M protein
VKASLLFLQGFTDEEKARFDAEQTKAAAETDAKYAADIAAETARLQAAIDAAKERRDAEARKAAQKALADYQRAMAEKKAAESRALLKTRFNYPIFMYEAEKVGITATGEKDQNELYPNPDLPPGIEKSCVELYQAFRQKPEPFFVKAKA